MLLRRLLSELVHIPSRLAYSFRTRGVRETLRRAGLLLLALRRETLSWNDSLNPLRRQKILRVTWPVSAIRGSTTYVFIFLGEFGYELFNWQGVIRKFSLQLPSSSRIVVAGKRGLEPFYETAAEYLNISDVPAYRESVAAAYWAIPPDQTRRDQTPAQLNFDRRLRAALREYVSCRLPRGQALQFIFSSDLTAFPGCIFGADHRHYGRPEHPGRIYAAEDMLANNFYARIEPHSGVRRHVEEKLQFDLSQPYILMQTRRRTIGPQYGMTVEEEPIIRALAGNMRVIVLTFNSGRALDSISSMAENAGALNYAGESFREQSCLIAHAARCVFVTNGDFGSHAYLPPFMGRDVEVIASEAIFRLPSAPIDFWNQNVFRFGGQIHPIRAEELFASELTLKQVMDNVLSCASNAAAR